jgi:hypothetical protein
MSSKSAFPASPHGDDFPAPLDWDREDSAEIVPFRPKPRSHVLARKRDASGRLEVDDDIKVPDIIFYAAR